MKRAGLPKIDRVCLETGRQWGADGGDGARGTGKITGAGTVDCRQGFAVKILEIIDIDRPSSLIHLTSHDRYLRNTMHDQRR